MKLEAAVVLAAILGQLAHGEVYFEERFEAEDWESRWVHSTWKGPNGPAGKFAWGAGTWWADEQQQKGIKTPNHMSYYGISAKLPEPFSNRGRDLVVQFSVKHEALAQSFCGGGYIKLLGADFDQEKFGGSTPYKIMFGPDICGSDVARIHVIFNFRGNNMLREPDIALDYDDKNEHSHLYTLVLKPDDTYVVYFDMKEKSAGSLHEYWAFPNKTNDDPTDSKPADWVETKMMDDPNAKKPANWVDEKRIRDPEAQAPDEWDEEEDGEWEAPYIENPNWHGAWFADRIVNPNWKGDWKPRQLDNPEYTEGVHAYDGIGAVGFELWAVNRGSVFDNILVTDSFDEAKAVGDSLVKLFEREKEVRQKGNEPPPLPRSRKEANEAAGKTAAAAGDGDYADGGHATEL